ncbi:MAG: HlyD family efflux transporter periplasmic adaptor subunit [Peptostreptococcaceae bacterium]
MKKIKYSNLLVLGILIYVIFNAVTSFVSKNIKTEVLENKKSEMKIKRECLIIRDEYLLKADSNGTLDLLVKEGEKVTKSQDVASIYSNVDKSIDDDISKLNEDIEKMENGEINISKEKITKYNTEIGKITNNVQKDLLENEYKNINEYKSSLESIVEDKNKLLNNGIDAVKLSNKQEQKSILENKRKNNVQTYSSTMSGIVSYKYDGEEEKYNYESINDITKSDIKNSKNNYTNIENLSTTKEGNVILRLINNYEAYIATYMNEEEIKLIENEKNIKLSNGDVNVEATLYDIFEKNGDFIAIFKINNQNIGIYDTRVEEFDIIYKQIEGLNIPKSSIKTLDNKRGVYVVDEEVKTPKFVELKGIEYEDDDFVYINYYKNQINEIETVDLYDKIILKPNFINTKMKVE